MKTVVITKTKAVKLYGNKAKLADALGISRQAVGQWPAGPIPQKHALRIYYELMPEAFQDNHKGVK
jgi:DNA-binding transcriptional regulator YdaS (Cro superfamily)